MDNIVTITTSHKTELEFDLSIEGLDDTGAVVHFIIKTEEFDMSFPCTRNGVKWEVTIPAMRSLDHTMYPFAIHVVVDGYFFVPLTGQVNAVKEAQVYASVPKPPSVRPSTLPSFDAGEDEEISIEETKPLEVSKPKRLNFKGKEYPESEEIGIHIEDNSKAFDNIIDKIVAEKNKTKPAMVEEPIEEIIEEPIEESIQEELSEVERLAKEIVEEVEEGKIAEELIKEPAIEEEPVIEGEVAEEPIEEVKAVEKEPVVEDDKTKGLVENIKEIKIDYIPKVAVEKEDLKSVVTGSSQRKAKEKVEHLIDDIKHIDVKKKPVNEEVEENVDEEVPVVDNVIPLELKDEDVGKILDEMKKPKAPKLAGTGRRKSKVLKKKMKAGDIDEEAELIAEAKLSEKDLKAKELLDGMKVVPQPDEKKPKKTVVYKKS